MEQHLNYIIEHFGYIGIIILLVGGIVGLPLPDEALLTYVGFSIFRDKLSYFPSLVSAFVGAAGGISLSYFIGHKLGLPLLHRFGPKVHITEQKIEYTRKLFNKIGPAILVVGYFIPGIRHLAAYIAAINNYPFKRFVVFAYSGAFIWIFTFITLGTVLGKDWDKVKLYGSKYSFYLIGFLLLLAVIYLFWKKRGRRRN
ncbi:DedA family protein [Neobacillus piezotolerans]|uniref:DedA family protein n=1 Tax=Neobacillus piezotolerans TaxID=2259171 RepID=A0A3D8GQX7_9BACI|nr:DedA family protein [Neobacillus piezotolerans]RDU36681.1 DedA family protein [Neobacillus piezotolerans]